MIVLKPTTDPQTFKYIPRDYTTVAAILLRDDTTNETIVYNPTITKVGDYLEITGVFNLVEGHFYDVREDTPDAYWNSCPILWELNDNTWDYEFPIKESVYVDLIFCTAQVINQNEDEEYNINKGVYITENTRNNDYVVL